MRRSGRAAVQKAQHGHEPDGGLLPSRTKAAWMRFDPVGSPAPRLTIIAWRQRDRALRHDLPRRSFRGARLSWWRRP